MKKLFLIKVSGKVQGVFFRVSAKQRADVLSVTGFVRNERDGTVYIEAEGEEDAITEFIEWCKVGPAGAQVDECNIQLHSEVKTFRNFTILR